MRFQIGLMLALRESKFYFRGVPQLTLIVMMLKVKNPKLIHCVLCAVMEKTNK